jgi:hypothetical protein
MNQNSPCIVSTADRSVDPSQNPDFEHQVSAFLQCALNMFVICTQYLSMHFLKISCTIISENCAISIKQDTGINNTIFHSVMSL